jgi:signal peptidase I
VVGLGAVLLGVLAGVLTAVVSTVVALRWWWFVVTVQGASMEPSLREGDRVLARRAGIADVHPGDVVVLERPDDDLRWTRAPGRRTAARGTLLIKRVAAVPGDPPPRRAAPALANHPERLVPPGHLVAFGDNYSRSLDSKQIGYFPADRLVGVVLRPMRGR